MTARIESATSSPSISIPSPHSIQRLDACIKSPARSCLTAPYHIGYCLSAFLLRRPAASRPCQKYRVCMCVKSNACSVHASGDYCMYKYGCIRICMYQAVSPESMHASQRCTASTFKHPANERYAIARASHISSLYLTSPSPAVAHLPSPW
jgi:hypothetical protein